MEDTTFKLTKLVGESAGGIEEAVKVALATSAANVQGQTWCQVTDLRADFDEQGGVDRGQVQAEVASRST